MKKKKNLFLFLFHLFFYLTIILIIKKKKNDVDFSNLCHFLKKLISARGNRQCEPKETNYRPNIMSCLTSGFIEDDNTS